jgi:iron complex outermembrane receptor protein
VVSYKFKNGIQLTIGGNNIFDVYPDQLFIDPRNGLAAVHANPTGPAAFPAAAKANSGYSAARDLSNRGRLLYNPNQFGYNGRFLFTRISVEPGQLFHHKSR